ncbi:MAG: HAD family hydrolase [Candidatus Hodarchaeota archaeon]
MSLQNPTVRQYNEIKAILFDFGGTLYHVSFDEIGLALRILKHLEKGDFPKAEIEHALTVAEDKFAKRMTAKQADRLRTANTSEDWIAFNHFILEALGVADPDRAIAIAMQEQWERFWDNVKGNGSVFSIRSDWKDTFDTLQSRGYEIGLISNTAVDLRPWLERDKVLPYLSVVIQSCEFGRAKPDPSIFHQACKELSLEPEQCAYVGNFYHADIIGAYNADLVPILIEEGNNIAELPPNPPFQFSIIRSLSEIIDLLPLSRS